jgi:hypothetical protein
MSNSNTTQTTTEWDEVRRTFASSIMVDTPLRSLAQNLDGPEWPVSDKEETPALYVDLPFPELIEALALKGMGPEYGDFLVSILRDTLAFDNPFGEMIEQNEAASLRDNQLLKNLAKLGIPEYFPIALIPLDPDTREFCVHENIETLGQLAVFAQTMSQNVIVGGDFRKLLNALAHIDEQGLAEVLPFRPGVKGLHLVETLAQATRVPNPAAHVALSLDWFPDELEEIKRASTVRGAIARHFAVLRSPDLERQALELLRPHFGSQAAKATGTFFGMFGRMFAK